MNTGGTRASRVTVIGYTLFEEEVFKSRESWLGTGLGKDGEGAGGKRGKPCFHTGSVVTTTVDLIQHCVSFHVDSTGIERSAQLSPASTWRFFVSLYNRKAAFTLLEVVELASGVL